MRSSKPVPRPFLKWAGGKSQLLDILMALVPANFHTYHEPFLGGGALFFALYRKRRIRLALLSDVNAELMDTYCAVKTHVEHVIELLRNYPYDSDFYYRLRSFDPNTLPLPERAARMIYLNRTCYNGLYRVNRKGQFNVPFGRYKNPRILDEKNLRAVARALRKAELLTASFESVLDRAQPGDFVYFDPPYAPVSKTADFTSYHADGFGPDHQRKLFEIAKELMNRGVYVLLSNSATDFIYELYAGDFEIFRVETRRAINSKSHKRAGWGEFVIRSPNYKPSKSLLIAHSPAQPIKAIDSLSSS